MPVTARRCDLAIGAAAIAFTLLCGCTPSANQSRLSPESEAHWQRDSSAYVRRLNKWLRDSTVIDSIARTVDIAPLRSLYVQLVSSKQPQDVYQSIYCVLGEVVWHYGGPATEIADARARGDVEQEYGEGAIDHALNRLPRRGVLSGRACGPHAGPVAQAYVGETNIHAIGPRPEPPPRPRH